MLETSPSKINIKFISFHKHGIPQDEPQLVLYRNCILETQIPIQITDLFWEPGEIKLDFVTCDTQ